MRFALGLSVVVGLILSCENPPDRWTGIPEAAACQPWDNYRTTCIANGQAYVCVNDTRGCNVDAKCAPISLVK